MLHKIILYKYDLYFYVNVIAAAFAVSSQIGTTNGNADGSISGFLYIRFNSYTQKDNTHCDSSMWPLRSHDYCDPYFIVSASTTDAGILGSYESRPIENAHRILQFGSLIGQLVNPLLFEFTDAHGLNDLPKMLEIQVTVKDHDPHTPDEGVDQFRWTLPVANLTTVSDSAAAVLTGSSRGDILSLSAWLTCRAGRFGRGCGVACRPQPPGTGRGGFGCDLATGEKVCLPGFKDPELGCLRRDYCWSTGAPVCANGGTCINTDAGHLCRCKDGFVGSECRTVQRPCEGSSNECARGVCLLTPEKNGRKECVCDTGFQGERCDQDIDECETGGLKPCQNGATCANTIGSFTCACRTGYTGTNCELPPMLMPPETAAASSLGGSQSQLPGASDRSQLTVILCSVIAALLAMLLGLTLLVLLLLRKKRRIRKSLPAVAWHRQQQQADCYYETVGYAPAAPASPDVAADAGVSNSNPYEMEEEEEDDGVGGKSAGLPGEFFANAAYGTAADTLPVRGSGAGGPAGPPTPPPRRCPTGAGK